MGHSLGDGIIVLAIAGAIVAYLYFRHIERRRRLEVIHQERLAAMDKGIPLPELPIDPLPAQKGTDSREVLLHGLVWLGLGGGAMLGASMMMLKWDGRELWPMLLPLVFLGGGLVLFYVLASNRSR